MRRTALLALLAATGLATASPASATYMDHVDTAGVHVYSCAPPGGAVTTYYCVRDTCVHN
jgi:hypothetical protein